MTLVLDLPPHLETAIASEAARKGVDPASLAIQRLLQDIVLPGAGSDLNDSDLLQQVNAGLPETFWSRYDALTMKRDNLTLTFEEQQELIALCDLMEQVSADRLVWLSILASRREVTVGALMTQLGIQPHTVSQSV